MSIDKKLIPVVAAYIGCDASYTHDDGHRYIGWSEEKDTKHDYLSGLAIYRLAAGQIHDLKLHLRTIEQITDEEIRETFKLIYFMPDASDNRERFLSMMENGDDLSLQTWADIINYLRSIGICVDPKLIESGFVELQK